MYIIHIILNYLGIRQKCENSVILGLVEYFNFAFVL